MTAQDDVAAPDAAGHLYGQGAWRLLHGVERRSRRDTCARPVPTDHFRTTLVHHLAGLALVEEDPGHAARVLHARADAGRPAARP